MNTSPKLFQSSLRMRKNIFAVHPGKNSCSCWYMNFLEFLRWDTNIVKLVLVNSFFRIILTKLLSSFDQIKLWSKKTRQEYWQTLPGRDESNKPNFWLRAAGAIGESRLQCAAHHWHHQDGSLQETEPAEEHLNQSRSSGQMTPSPIIIKLFQYSTSHLKLPSPWYDIHN